MSARSDISREAPALAIKLFGPMEVRVQGELLSRFRSRKSLWLLALLTLRHDRPVERAWLAGTLWPETLPHQALSNLAAVLSDLRKALGDQKTRLQAPTHQTLLLDLSAGKDANGSASCADVDVAVFDSAIKAGDLLSLQKAVALYCGPFLEGCPEEWVEQERREREQNCLRAFQTLAEAAQLAKNYNEANVFWQRALGIDPLWDKARRGAMETFAALGDRNAALQIYREFARLLNHEPNTAPDKETTALYRRLRTVSATPPADAVNSGSKKGAISSGYLPHPITRLIGRDDECSEVSDKLKQARLVTLTGSGGIGKTRLALEVAAQIAGRYTGGVWFVALETLQTQSDSSSVFQQISARFGLKESPQTHRATVTEHLREMNLLLVLDNCEQVLSASAEVAAYLLRECAGVRILATSRMALGITGETAWAVPPLTVPDPAQLPSGLSALARILSGFDSVQLFTERAQAVQQTFTLTGSTALPVAQVCARLEGVPLAIELAAARVKSMTLPQIAARLENHWGQLDLLQGVNRTALSRQQTMRATLDWSYALLNEPERILLSRLSVFAGGCTLQAAEYVGAGDGIDRDSIPHLLESLLDKSLVRFDPTSGESGRYVLLEVVRQYASEHLEASDAAKAVQARHREWFLRFAEAMQPELETAQNEAALRQIEADYDNLRAFLAWCETDPSAGEVGLRLTAALWRLWNLRSDFREGRQFLEGALARAGAAIDPKIRMKALTGLGALNAVLHDYTAANTAYSETLAFYREQGNRNEIAFALSGLAGLATNRGDYAEARTRYEESLSLYRELTNHRGMAKTLLYLGMLRKTQGDLDPARADYEESLMLFREVGDRRNTAVVLTALGQIASIRAEFAAARMLLDEGLAIFVELNAKRYVAVVNQILAATANSQNDFESAQHHINISADIFRSMGDRSNVAWSLLILGETHMGQNNYALARSIMEESLHLFEEIENKQGRGVTLQQLGVVSCRAGDPVSARVLHEKSLTLNQELGQQLFVAMNLEGFASVKLLLPKPDRNAAVRLWGAASVLRAQFDAPRSAQERALYEREVAETQAFLGEDAFTKAWEQGKAMTSQEAAAYALQETDAGL